MDNLIERISQIEQGLIKQTLENLSPQNYMRELRTILGYDGVPDEFKRATRVGSLLEEIKEQELKTFLELGSSQDQLRALEAFSAQAQSREFLEATSLQTTLREFGAPLKRDTFIRGKQEQRRVLQDWPALRLPDPNLEDDPAPPPRHAKTPARLENTEIVISQNMPKGAGMPTPHYDGLAHVVWYQTKSHF